MLFRQLLDPDTCTYTYLLADEETGEAVLVDPVREQVDRDVRLLEELGLRLVYALETHVHADHVTGGGQLRRRLGCRLVVGGRSGVLTADVQVGKGDTIRFGRHRLEVRETPGHTDGCVTYVCHRGGMAFTGDVLLIRGCGRTDFQQGNARTLYQSVHSEILSLPEATRLYPGHDYNGQTVTTVAEEKRFNPRLGSAKGLEDFLDLMSRLDLAYPSRMLEAVPANMASGVTEPEQVSPSTLESDRWAPVQRTASGVPVVSTEWLAAHRTELRLVDVREHIEFCGPLGHIEGAELVPLAALSETAREWDRDEPVVTLCTHGTRSGKAALMLQDQGFIKVVSLHRGMTGWKEERRPAVEVMGGRSSQDAAIWLGMGI
jgi:glyoxylase-like metal-dependent hydrolase (beta-lactamase superfamily II)/rhodanese-related sulfurtransferase